MTPHPLTVDEHTTVADARDALRTHGIRGLPVTRRGGELIGVITDSDLRETLTWLPRVAAGLSADVRRAIDAVEVGVLMDRTPMHIGADAPLERAAAIMRTRRVHGLPVTADGTVCGIITDTDIMRAFEVSLGADSPGHRTVVDLGGGAPLWQHLKMLDDAGNPATHVVAFRNRRGGNPRATLRTARPIRG